MLNSWDGFLPLLLIWVSQHHLLVHLLLCTFPPCNNFIIKPSLKAKILNLSSSSNRFSPRLIID